MLELIAKAEPLISEHLRKSSTVSGKVSYLSATIQNEFISILANNVVQKIIHEVRNAKYYSIIIDSTPDVSHIEQLSFVLRYTYFDHHYRKVEIIERFIGYVELGSTTGESIAHKIIENISKLGLDIFDCRNQGYDNGANMAGFVKGVQNRISSINKKAIFIPCHNHTLNLVVVDAVHSCTQAVNFFGIVQRLYTLFSASPKRWTILKKKYNFVCIKTS